MMAEIGQFALVFCLALAVWQVGLAVFHILKPSPFGQSTLLRRLSYLQFVAVLLSFAALMTVFTQSDTVVAAYSLRLWGLGRSVIWPERFGRDCTNLDVTKPRRAGRYVRRFHHLDQQSL